MHPQAKATVLPDAAKVLPLEPHNQVVGAIPARYASTRLPGKPLRQLAGRPLIEHVYRRASAARGLARVVVLTDDERIGAAVEEFGGEWEMTPTDCASGMDRIAFAAGGWPQVAAVVNIQGDEPLIHPEAISQIAAHLAEHPEDPMVTLACPADEGDLDDPQVVKAVCDRSGLALYFSRAPIPYRRSKSDAPQLRHLGIYGYQRSALLELASWEPTPLERAEALEQLRALENRMPIRVLHTPYRSLGVDTAEDLARLEKLLTEHSPEP